MEQPQKSGAPSKEEVEELPQEKQKNDPGEYFYISQHILGIKSHISTYELLFVCTGSPPITRFLGQRITVLKEKRVTRRSSLVLEPGNGTFYFESQLF